MKYRSIVLTGCLAGIAGLLLMSGCSAVPSLSSPRGVATQSASPGAVSSGPAGKQPAGSSAASGRNDPTNAAFANLTWANGEKVIGAGDDAPVWNISIQGVDGWGEHGSDLANGVFAYSQENGGSCAIEARQLRDSTYIVPGDDRASTLRIFTDLIYAGNDPSSVESTVKEFHMPYTLMQAGKATGNAYFSGPYADFLADGGSTDKGTYIAQIARLFNKPGVLLTLQLQCDTQKEVADELPIVIPRFSVWGK